MTDYVLALPIQQKFMLLLKRGYGLHLSSAQSHKRRLEECAICNNHIQYARSQNILHRRIV